VTCRRARRPRPRAPPPATRWTAGGGRRGGGRRRAATRAPLSGGGGGAARDLSSRCARRRRRRAGVRRTARDARRPPREGVRRRPQRNQLQPYTHTWRRIPRARTSATVPRGHGAARKANDASSSTACAAARARRSACRSGGGGTAPAAAPPPLTATRQRRPHHRGPRDCDRCPSARVTPAARGAAAAQRVPQLAALERRGGAHEAQRAGRPESYSSYAHDLRQAAVATSATLHSANAAHIGAHSRMSRARTTARMAPRAARVWSRDELRARAGVLVAAAQLAGRTDCARTDGARRHSWQNGLCARASRMHAGCATVARRV